MRCYTQRSLAVARNYEKVRCGSVVHKNCQDVTAYAVGSLQEGTSASHLECGLAWAQAGLGLPKLVINFPPSSRGF